MQTHAEQLAQFKTLARLRTPRALRAIAIILGIAIVLSLAGLVYVPWVQTAQGTGSVIALDPRDRVQNITALVPGRIERWYVTDGTLVKQGDPIARIVDNDPQLLDRLRAERAQKQAEIAAAEIAAQTAMLDVNRTGALFREGLAARRDYESAQIKVADYRAKIAQSRAAINKVEVDLARQSAQLVVAPRAGRIMRIDGGDTSTLVKQGDVLATFAPDESVRVVELYVDGRDVPLITPGRRVRLAFEGWPTIQFSGWPSIAQGLFDARVRAIDVSASEDGRFRILVEPAPDRDPWPREPFVRLGAKVRGWVLMDTVSAGFELWRQLNDFPLQFERPEQKDKPLVKPKERKIK
ncbi:MAG: HlyD family efflux transporter periplasmic adaptor subunit [Sphingomonas sp.]|uniref:efflux RND transporter periplasmic adaptor subunit n=1 Tax=Sphingomonas sp. TaxID=28214 RepID=UPI000DAF88C9|nr:RND transporter [Zymomonas sp.]MBA4772912.1 HlyD family efflux transporter periplasmic adaptor subunit [Sphingomonas sp.]PZP19478.1 MAG: RND transporter [Sphingomonas hengshuiensis]